MKIMYYVLIAGALGAMARYGTRLFITDRYNILLVNIIGSFLLVIVFDYFGEKNILSSEACGAVGTGFIGAFTTFSAFSYENVSLFLSGYRTEALVYSVTCLLGGLLAAAAGMSLCHLLLRGRKEAE
ncbi:MAG: CrcB family protein [Eubacteriaceae bacterium]|nr:CrcB family protein [Eubacteriaceae bacterium]